MAKRLTAVQIEDQFVDMIEHLDRELRYLINATRYLKDRDKRVGGMVHALVLMAMASAPGRMRKEIWDYTSCFVESLGQESFEDIEDVGEYVAEAQEENK